MTPLSDKEQQILEGLAKDQSPQEIAYCLGVSVRTLEDMIWELKLKLACNTRFQMGVKYGVMIAENRKENTEG